MVQRLGGSGFVPGGRIGLSAALALAPNPAPAESAWRGCSAGPAAGKPRTGGRPGGGGGGNFFSPSGPLDLLRRRTQGWRGCCRACGGDRAHPLGPGGSWGSMAARGTPRSDHLGRSAGTSMQPAAVEALSARILSCLGLGRRAMRRSRTRLVDRASNGYTAAGPLRIRGGTVAGLWTWIPGRRCSRWPPGRSGGPGPGIARFDL